MRWNLSDVGLPNCVPEYFREQFEREEHEAELRWERTEHYNTNRQKIKNASEAGLPVLLYGGYNGCQCCRDADHDTQTSDDDDICCVICHNPDCPEHRKHKGE